MPSYASHAVGPLRENILGVRVSVVTIPHAVAVIDGWIDTHAASYVCITGAHGVVSSLEDRELRAIHNRAGMVTPDGMPLVWFCRWRGHGERVGRVYGPDLMEAVCGHGLGRGYRHFFYGGGPGVPEKLAAALGARFPGLAVAGCLSPPFGELSPSEDAEIVQQIKAARPDIVWVGLSTPKQERWMAAHLGRIAAPAMIGVGAAFDFHSGLKVQAPRWMQRNGLEWLFRLVTEPRRLWKRYLKVVPVFLVLGVLQAAGILKFRD
ncbi:MAG: WecB/TagA/CpsF family glycosyltransferase [Rhodospirillales bacterium]|nr:WecB/TagA/CpsF family glycosyltransferase [Rhodospirillales bacterium]